MTGALISSLVDAEATEAADLIERIFRTCPVDEGTGRTWEEAQYDLGLREPPEGYYDEEDEDDLGSIDADDLFEEDDFEEDDPREPTWGDRPREAEPPGKSPKERAQERAKARKKQKKKKK